MDTLLHYLKTSPLALFAFCVVLALLLSLVLFDFSWPADVFAALIGAAVLTWASYVSRRREPE